MKSVVNTKNSMLDRFLYNIDCVALGIESDSTSQFTPMELFSAIKNPKVMSLANLIGDIRMRALQINSLEPSEPAFTDTQIHRPAPVVRSGNMAVEEKEFLTTEEAAHFLRLSRQSLLNMTSNGHVPVCKLGRRNRYRLQDLKDLLLSNRRGGF